MCPIHLSCLQWISIQIGSILSFLRRSTIVTRPSLISFLFWARAPRIIRFCRTCAMRTCSRCQARTSAPKRREFCGCEIPLIHGLVQFVNCVPDPSFSCLVLILFMLWPKGFGQPPELRLFFRALCLAHLFPSRPESHALLGQDLLVCRRPRRAEWLGTLSAHHLPVPPCWWGLCRDPASRTPESWAFPPPRLSFSSSSSSSSLSPCPRSPALAPAGPPASARRLSCKRHEVSPPPPLGRPVCLCAASSSSYFVARSFCRVVVAVPRTSFFAATVSSRSSHPCATSSSSPSPCGRSARKPPWKCWVLVSVVPLVPRTDPARTTYHTGASTFRAVLLVWRCRTRSSRRAFP